MMSSLSPAGGAPRFLLLHDSELAHAEWSGDTLTLRLAAAHVREGQGQGAVDGYAPRVWLRCTGAQAVRSMEPALGRLAQGRWRQDGGHRSELPLPFESQVGPVVLELTFAQGAQWTLHAQAIQVGQDGAATFNESMAC